MTTKCMSKEGIRSRMKIHGRQVLSWYTKNFLLAGPHKFHSLNISPLNLDEDKRDEMLNINDLVIANTELIKLLGVHIDDSLNFTEHISKLCTKASQKVGVLSRLRNFIPCKAKLSLYKSFILPYLTYCHLTWRFYKSCNKRKLERIQERGLNPILTHMKNFYDVLI